MGRIKRSTTVLRGLLRKAQADGNEKLTASLAVQLSQAENRDSLEKARAERAKRRAAAAKPATPAVPNHLDPEWLSEVIEFDEPPHPDYLTWQAQQQNKTNQVPAATPEPAPVVAIPEPEPAIEVPKHDSGTSVTLTAFAFPTSHTWNEREGLWEVAGVPSSSLGLAPNEQWSPIANDAVGEPLTWTAGTGWQHEHEAQQKSQEDAAWEDYMNKFCGRR